MDCEIVILTTPSKFKFWTFTQFGILSQLDVKFRIWLGVDMKPNDELPEYDDGINVIPYRTNDLWNHAHGITNDIIFNHLEGNPVVVLMNDDYWFEETTFLRRLLMGIESGTFRHLESHQRFGGYYADYTPFLFNNPIRRFANIGYSYSNAERIVVSSLDMTSERHPFRGHPKCFLREDFCRTEGYDTSHFQHYYWSDLDLFLRFEKLVRIRSVPGRVFHMDHDRYLPYEFEAKNRSVFGTLYPAHLDLMQQSKEEERQTHQFERI